MGTGANRGMRCDGWDFPDGYGCFAQQENSSEGQARAGQAQARRLRGDQATILAILEVAHYRSTARFRSVTCTQGSARTKGIGNLAESERASES